jgi:hypothetical protein
MAPSAFVFERYAYDPDRAALSLHYRFESGPSFVEEVAFDGPARAISDTDAEALDRIFRLIFLFAGVSYYKACVPETLVCEAFPLDRETAYFLRQFYKEGLAELAFRNGLSLRGRCRFAADDTAAIEAPVALDLPRRTLVPVGGGKDSVVTLECLKGAGADLALFTLGDAEPIRACIATSGLPFVRVRRRLDPGLFELNARGAFNGHVPITGILSAIALAAAVLCGCDAVAMSNEHSASAPNLEIDGAAVNHQYSKSLKFETDLAAYLRRRISPDLAYFSLLRPLSEIEIARRFSRHRAYFPVFRSCNTAFKQAPGERRRQWCCDCPKCRFVFLALAPFVAKTELIGIFGRNLLDDPSQADGFAALCGLGRHKPFECVGETAESAALMAHLGRHPDWRDDAAVRRLHADFPSLREAEPCAYRTLAAARHRHRVPERYLAMLDAGG